jgi:chitosanase
MLNSTQIQTAQSIVNLFETGAVLGDYGNVTVIAGGIGHLTFGRSQPTLGSRNLFDLLNRYCSNPGAQFGKRLAPWLPRFEATDLSLDDDTRLHNTLRATADDKVFRGTALPLALSHTFNMPL